MKLKSECNEDMQNIVRLLVEFDEKTGHYRRYEDPETHWMRKAVAYAGPDLVEFDVEPIESLGYAYRVTATVTSGETTLKTVWIHEDAIRTERNEMPENHPVHKIVCLTDLYEKSVAQDQI